MLVPNVLQVVLLLRTVFVVQQGTRFADEDAVVQYTVARLVFHAVYAKLVKFVFDNILVEVRNQVWMLNLWKVLWHHRHLF